MAFSRGTTASGTAAPATAAPARPATGAAAERRTRLIDAARALAAATGSSAFTVAQVVERSGLSLKSFYAEFAGKDDLLFALLAEDSAVGAALLADLMSRHRTPVTRAKAWVDGLFELMAAGEPGYVGVLVREHRRLADAAPDQLAAALAPFRRLLVAQLEAAATAGTARPGDPDRDAATVLDLVLLQIHELVLARQGRGTRVDGADGARAAAAYVWSFVWHGLGAEDRR